MITVRTEGFCKGFLHLSRVLVTQTKERLSGQSWTNGPAESRPQRPCQNSLTNDQPLILASITLWPCSPWIFKQSRLPSARWVGLSQSVEGPETENRFSREERMEFGLKTMTQKPCLSFQLKPACPTNSCDSKLQHFTYLNIQTASRPCTFWTCQPPQSLAPVP